MVKTISYCQESETSVLSQVFMTLPYLLAIITSPMKKFMYFTMLSFISLYISLQMWVSTGEFIVVDKYINRVLMYIIYVIYML